MVSPGPTPNASRTVFGKATWLLLESLLICIIYSFTLYRKVIAVIREMSMTIPKRKMLLRTALWGIALIGVIVPRRLRADWRLEWEAELRYREMLLADWEKLDRRNKLALLWHSAGAFMDALWLQPRRMEDEMFQDLRYGFRML